MDQKMSLIARPSHLFFGLLLIALVFWRQSVAPAQENDSAISLLKMAEINCAALQRYDVLMRIDEFQDNPDGTYVSETTFQRLLIDLEHKKAARFARMSREQVTEDKGEESFNGIAATLISNTNAISRRWPDQPAKSTHPSFPSALWQRNLFPLNLAGYFDYPPSVRGIDLDATKTIDSLFDQVWGKLKIASVAKEMRNSESGLLTGFTIGPVPFGRSDMEEFSEINVGEETQMPTERQVVYYKTNRRSLGPKNSYKWEEMDGYVVPSEIFSETLFLPSTQQDSIPKPGTLTTRIRIEWLSINTELDLTYFEERILLNVERVRKATDPAELGRTELLDTLHSE